MTETWREATRWLSSWLPMTREDDRPVGSFRGAFIKDVARSIILRTTSPGDWIWDAFGGSGTTGIVAEELGRECLMTDLNPVHDGIALGDARYVTFDEPVSLVILHPPYHQAVVFSDNPSDLSRCATVDDFLDSMAQVYRNVSKHVKKAGFIALVMGDVWESGNGLVPLSFLAMQRLLDEVPDAQLRAIQIKDIKNHASHMRGKRNLWLSRFFRWGACSLDHEYIFTFRIMK